MSAYVYIYTHMHTLNNRFLVSLFFKPLDKLLVGDFQSGTSPRSRETFLQTLCIGCSTVLLPWWKGTNTVCRLLLLQHYPNLQNCTANKQTSKKKEAVCFTLQDHSTTKSNILKVHPQYSTSKFDANKLGCSYLLPRKKKYFLLPVDAHKQLKY